jgi:hypothetical protein
VKTERLIRRLVADAMPTPVTRPVSTRLAWWVAVTAVVTAVPVSVSILRGKGPGESALATGFLGEAALTLIIALSAAFAALTLSVPGRERPLITVPVPVVSYGAWLVWLAAGVSTIPVLTAGTWLAPPAAKCAAHVLAASLPAGAWLAWLVREGAPLRPRLTGVMTALAAGATGALATQLTCVNRAAPHILLWHAVPVFAVAASGVLMAGLLAAWRRGAAA